MRVFFDTNVLVYAYDPRDPRKLQIAAELIAQGIRTSTGVISAQVLSEFALTALQKLHQSSQIVVQELRAFEELQIIQLAPELIRQAVEVRELYKIHFWDAQIIAAAEAANCEAVLSEDLSAG